MDLYNHFELPLTVSRLTIDEARDMWSLEIIVPVKEGSRRVIPLVATTTNATPRDAVAALFAELVHHNALSLETDERINELNDRLDDSSSHVLDVQRDLENRISDLERLVDRLQD